MSDFIPADVVENRTDFGIFERAPQRGINYAAYPAAMPAQRNLHPTKRADFSRHGYRAAQFDDAFARFLPDEPNIRTLKRGREGM